MHNSYCLITALIKEIWANGFALLIFILRMEKNYG